MIVDNYIASFFLITLGLYCIVAKYNTLKTVIGRSIMDFKGREIEELAREGLVSVRKTPGAGAVIALTSRGLDLANYVFRAFV